MRAGVRSLIAAAALLVAAAAGAAAPQDGASAAVQRLHAALLSAMKNGPQLGFQGRYDALAPVLRQVFNLPAMARIAAGSHWAKLSPAQRESLVGAFSRVTIATYAERFDSFDGERFEISGQRQGPRRAVLVMARIVPADDEPVPLTYVLRRAGDARWQIVDILLKGAYSELATRRAEYTSILDREGFDALIQKLDAKFAQYAAGR